MPPSNIPARAPERQPEPATSTPRPFWPAPERPRVPLRVLGNIPQ